LRTFSPQAAGSTDDTGGLGIRIGEIPDSVKDIPSANTYIVFKLAPSQSYSQKIIISNTTKSSMNVKLYAEDATNIKDSFLPSDSPIPNQLASWTSVSPSIANVKAHSNLVATVTIKVPSSAKNGDQFGIVWASIKTSPNSNGIGGVSRVGIRMYTPVGDASSSTSTSKPDMTNWFQDHATAYELGGLISLLLSITLIAAVLVRREKKRAKKRRKKLRESD
jgi:hypothetical protein